MKKFRAIFEADTRIIFHANNLNDLYQLADMIGGKFIIYEFVDRTKEYKSLGKKMFAGIMQKHYSNEEVNIDFNNEISLHPIEFDCVIEQLKDFYKEQ